MGSAPIAVPSLEYLVAHHDLRGVVTQPDRPQGRKRELTPTAVKVAALRLGQTVLQPRKLKAPEFLEPLRAMAPDVIVVMAYGRLVPAEVLGLPRFGCINLHGSVLPRYRGPCPVERALIEGETSTGITTFYMAEGFDTGDIILTEAIAIADDDSGGSLRDKLSVVAARVIARTLDLLERGEAPRLPQDHAAATHAPIVTRDEGHVDWSRPAAAIDRLVRGCDPEPGAWATFRGQPLKVRRVAVAEAASDGAAPGEIVGVDPRGPRVAADHGAVILVEVQPAGKKWMSGAQFAGGYRPQAGERLQ